MPTKLPFKIVHVSGQDDCFRAAELNNHSPLTKGWQSSRFCLYPQDIVLQLEGRCRLRKIQILSHQYLIATKIEFYVGDVPDSVAQSLDTARYTRLGYVSLSDNEKTGYKARELKSVHVDAVGVYLKLNIHKNHVNKFNLYNQVGVVAINVIGDKLNKSYDITDPEYMLEVGDNRTLDKDPALEGFFNRPDYISPLDDLAFDMYQDPEIAQIIRKLERKKQEAVLQERYDYAKRLKHAISELQKELDSRYDPNPRNQSNVPFYPSIHGGKFPNFGPLRSYDPRRISMMYDPTKMASFDPSKTFDPSIGFRPSGPFRSCDQSLPYLSKQYGQYMPPSSMQNGQYMPPSSMQNGQYMPPSYGQAMHQSSMPYGQSVPQSSRQYEQPMAHSSRLYDSIPDQSIPSPRKLPRVRKIHIDTAELLRGVEDGDSPMLEIALENDEVLNLSLDITHTVGEKLGKMEVEKRQAVENEDYDKAKIKKLQMDEYRLQIYKDLNLPDLLELNRSRHPQPEYEPVRQTTPPRPTDFSRSPRSPPRSPPRYDERPLPISHRESSPKLDLESELDTSPRPAYEDRPLPIHKPAVVVEEEPEPEPEPEAGEPEPMTEKDIRDASSAIDIFGHPLVSKAYSKTWSYREDSLLAVHKQMVALPSSVPKEEAKAMMRAAIFLIKRAIEDKVYAVFRAALQLEKVILTEYVPKHRISRQETSSAVERTIPNLLHKSGDTAARNRDDAKRFIQDMSNFPDVRPTNVVPHECVKPIKTSMAPRLAQSRLEIVETLYKDLGLSTTGLNVENLMPFCVEALNHNAGEVREVAERIIRSLYSEVGAPVKDYLPPDDDKTRKNTLWRQLFEYFDKVDGKPSKSDIKKQKADGEAKKQAEIEALQKQLQQLKDMAAGKAPMDQNLVKGNRKTQPTKFQQKNKPRSRPTVSKPPEDDDNMDKICIFCGEKNEAFNDEGLDLHYWKNCPMLKRCANCKQVVEIASLTDHLLTECEAKNNFSKCPRCSEAILKSEYDQHVAEKSCNPSKGSTDHCPLCHQNLVTGDDAWKGHLMEHNGCKQNPRRLLALNKPAGAQSKLPAPKGKTGVKGKAGRGGR